jgi:hypothetical protein
MIMLDSAPPRKLHIDACNLSGEAILTVTTNAAVVYFIPVFATPGSVAGLPFFP